MVDGLTGQGVDADFSHSDVHVLHVAVEAQELPSVRRVLHHLGRQTNVGDTEHSWHRAPFPALALVVPSSRSVPSTPYLGHVNDAHCEGLVAQDGAVLVPLPPLQHDLQLVAVSLEKVRVLGEGSTGRGQREGRAWDGTRGGRELFLGADIQQDLTCPPLRCPSKATCAPHHPPNPHCPEKHPLKLWSSRPAA